MNEENFSIMNIKMSKRLRNVCKSLGINTLYDLKNYDYDKIEDTRGVGVGTLKEIINLLQNI